MHLPLAVGHQTVSSAIMEATHPEVPPPWVQADLPHQPHNRASAAVVAAVAINDGIQESATDHPLIRTHGRMAVATPTPRLAIHSGKANRGQAAWPHRAAAAAVQLQLQR
jgi:hypothetical protein